MASGMTVRKDFRKLDQIIRDTPERGDRMLAGAAIEITGDIVVSFTTSPSSPGEPPGVDTGSLRASMHWEKVGNLHYIVADAVAHGIFMELGTSTIAPRPFMNPVFEEWRVRKFAQFIKDFGLIS